MSYTISTRKILQALFYIQNHAPAANNSKQTVMYFLKILFFADRYHMRHYGCLASDDSYYAMKNGPVASAAKDIMNNKLPECAAVSDANLLKDVESLDEYSVYIKPQSDDELSESFKEALDFSISNFGKFCQFDLSDISHDYPEWKKFEKKLGVDGNRFLMDEKDFLLNPDTLEKSKTKGLQDDVFTMDEDFLNALRDKID